MDGKRVYQSLRLKNFLSYGPDGAQLELMPLNVLIGQNASGKSNLIQALRLVRAIPANLSAPLFEGGGVKEFIYKGQAGPSAEIEVDVEDTVNQDVLRHSIAFAANGQRLQIQTERIASLRVAGRPNTPEYYYQNQLGKISLQAFGQKFVTRQTPDGPKVFVIQGWQDAERITTPSAELSIVAQRTDPDSYPALAYLHDLYASIRIYGNIDLESPNSLRATTRPDLPDDFVEESGRNLSIILNDLEHRGVMDDVVKRLRVVNDDIEAITVKISGGTVQTFIRERGLRDPIPAARLSDGTLRYLCLLAILTHPAPPPLICLEEPEIGMHPDVISALAELLVEASQRTQLIVTTHSDRLVSALSHVPEAIVVCERSPNGTTLQRLESDRLKLWLEKYNLGDLWLKGELGGTRW